jgi:hypothetical protein
MEASSAINGKYVSTSIRQKAHTPKGQKAKRPKDKQILLNLRQKDINVTKRQQLSRRLRRQQASIFKYKCTTPSFGAHLHRVKIHNS